MKTKTLSLLVVFILFGIGAAHAQIPGFSLGLKASYLYSTMPSSITQARTGHDGFQIGAFARLGGRTYIQPEFNYETLGGKFNFEANSGFIAPGTGVSGGSVRVDAKYDRVDIPILLGHKFLSLPLLSLRGYIGPDFGFKSSASTGSSASLDPQYYDYKHSTVGGIVGIGVDIGSLTIDGRYNLGFTQVNDGFETKLNSFAIGIGFKFL